MTLRGRHALVTGAGRGIGQAIARALATRGMRLTVVARNVDELETTRALCRKAGAPLVNSAPANLTQRHQLENLCRGVARDVDVVINNAGVAPSATMERTDDEQWDGAMALNAHAPFALCRAVLPYMVRRGFGRVVNVASSAGTRGFAYTSAYCASKHALVGLTRALAAELAARTDADVTINAVCPGFVDTSLVQRAAEHIATTTGCTPDEARLALAALNEGGRLLTPEQVAAAVLALVAEEPGRTQGAAVALNGPPA